MKVWSNTSLVYSGEITFEKGFWPEGSGFFETLRTENGDVYELGRHMRRAISSSERLGIRLPGENVVREGIQSILEAQPHTIGQLRLLFSPSRFIAVHQAYIEIKAPLRVSISQSPSASSSTVLKEFPYSSNLRALAAARESGYDEVLRHNLRGELTEGAVSNFLFRMDRTWVTTPLTSGVLPGVMRAIAIERANVSVRSILLSEVPQIESAICLSSLKLSLPVSEIDGFKLNQDENMNDLIALIREKTQRGSVG